MPNTFDDVCCPILELRQYTLHPGARDTLVRLFDRELIETQEAAGMRIVGQFRDRDDPDRFVWVRGFADMASRAEALAAFYGGPAWKAHAREANATMVDSDDVLLLRPADAGGGFDLRDRIRPAAGADTVPPALVVATICHRATPVDDEFLTFFQREVEPVLIKAGGAPVARLRTEYAENTFPAPVSTRTDTSMALAAHVSVATMSSAIAVLVNALRTSLRANVSTATR